MKREKPGRIVSSRAFPLLAALLSLLSCPGVTDPADLPETADASEWLYDLTASGSFTAGGRAYAASSAQCEPFVEYSSLVFNGGASVVPKCKVSVRFTDTRLCLTFLLERADGAWKVSDTAGRPRHYFAYAAQDDGYFHFYDSPYPYYGSSAVLAVEADPKTPGVIRSLRITAGAAGRYAAAAPDDGISSITAVDVTLVFSAPRGYIAEDLVTAREIDEVRNMDTRSWTRTVPADVLAGLVSSPGVWVGALVSHLTAGVEDPIVRLKILHDWVSGYVYADQPAGQGQYAAPAAPFEVLSTRRSLCAGQVRLLQYLGRLAGIGVRYVEGAVKYAAYAVPADVENHAWAMVRVNGALRFIETAWDGENVYTAAGLWSAYPHDSGYFLQEDALMRVDHLPFKAAYNSSGTPMTLAEFYAAPYLPDNNMGGSSVTGCFHDAGLALAGPLPPILAVDGSPARVDLSSTGEAVLSAVVFGFTDGDGDGVDDYYRDWTFLQKSGSTVVLYLRPARAGIWRAYLRDTPASGTRNLMQLRVDVSSTAGSDHPYPAQYGPYQTSGAVLVSPMTGELPAETAVSVDVTVPGAVKIWITPVNTVVGRAYLDCDTDGRAVGSYTVPAASDPLYLYAEYSDGSTATILGYRVAAGP